MRDACDKALLPLSERGREAVLDVTEEGLLLARLVRFIICICCSDDGPWVARASDVSKSRMHSCEFEALVNQNAAVLRLHLLRTCMGRYAGAWRVWQAQ